MVSLENLRPALSGGQIGNLEGIALEKFDVFARLYLIYEFQNNIHESLTKEKTDQQRTKFFWTIKNFSSSH